MYPLSIKHFFSNFPLFPSFIQSLLMKHITLIMLLLAVLKTAAQKPLVLPDNAEPGRGYGRCLMPDSIYKKENHSGPILPMAWETFILEKVPKYQRFDLELPVFDSINLKIPVDKTTRMADIPDQYGLTTTKIKVKEPTTKWIFRKEIKECLSTYPEDCLVMYLLEVPAEYKTIQKRVVIATAHQRRYDDVDTIVLKQVVETKTLKISAIEAPPQYQTVFMKTHPHTQYSEWRQVVCSSRHNISVRMIQTALKKRGYAVQIDDVMGAKTKKALLHFQKEKGLPMGNLNVETLKALGVWRDYDY
jgi:hypothetical protein